MSKQKVKTINNAVGHEGNPSKDQKTKLNVHGLNLFDSVPVYMLLKCHCCK